MWIAVVIYLIINISGLTLMKQGMSKSSFDIFNSNTGFLSIESILDFRVVLGSVLYVLSFLTWLYLLKKYDLSYIFPIVTGLSYIGVLTVSFFLLSERFNLIKLVGATLILVGVMLIYKNNI